LDASRVSRACKFYKREREKGHDVKILDRNLYYDNKKLISILKNFNPDIVGMTCYTSPVIKDVKQVSKIVKENSNALVIIGGVHATLEPASLLNFPYIDYVVRGEGEFPLLEICQVIDKKKTSEKKKIDKQIKRIKNINYNEMRSFINLSELPIPDYSLLEIKKYPVATFYTSRGCPGRCRFCYNLGRTLRFYSTEKVIETITGVLDKYKIREFTIADDNFANLSKRTERICQALSKYNSIFHIFLRVDQVYDKVMKNLKKAGCWAIQFGFESGSQRILDFIHKDTTVEQNIKAIKQCKKYRIFVDGSFMVGLPTETIAEMKETINFIKKYKPDAPYPGTELYEYSINHGLMKRPRTLDDWIRFSDLKEGEPNVSEIPTLLLLKVVNQFSKTSFSLYLKKALLLLSSGHIRYALFKTSTILKKKFGLRHNDQKTRIKYGTFKGSPFQFPIIPKNEKET